MKHMKRKRYIQPTAENVMLNTSDDVMQFPFFDTSVGDGLGKKNDQPVIIDDEDEEEEMENDSVKYTPSYRRYKPFEDWKGKILDW